MGVQARRERPRWPVGNRPIGRIVGVRHSRRPNHTRGAQEVWPGLLLGAELREFHARSDTAGRACVHVRSRRGCSPQRAADVRLLRGRRDAYLVTRRGNNDGEDRHDRHRRTRSNHRRRRLHPHRGRDRRARQRRDDHTNVPSRPKGPHRPGVDTRGPERRQHCAEHHPFRRRRAGELPLAARRRPDQNHG